MTLRGIGETVRGTVAGLRGDGRGRILVVIACGWFLVLGVRLVLPALLPFVSEAFSLDLASAGALVTVLYAVYALGQFPGGLLGDRIGERNVLTLAAALGFVAVVLLSLPLAFPVFVCGIVLYGFGTALYSPTRLTVLSDVYDEHDGAAIGLTLGAGNAGNAVLPAFAGLLATYASWRLGFGFAIPLFLALTVALWVTIPKSTSPTPDVETLSRAMVSRIGAAFFRREVLLATALMFVSSVLWQAVTGLYPTYLVVEKGLSGSEAALLFGLLFGFGMFFQPIAGAAGDRFGARRTLAVIFVVAIGALSALPFARGPLALVAVTLALTSLLNFAAITFPYVNAALPSDVQGGGLGLVRTAYMTLASTGPAAVGALGGAGYFDEAFFALAGVGLLGLALTAKLPPAPRSE